MINTINQKSKTVLYIGGFELPDKNAAAQRVISNAKIFRSLGFSIVFIGIDKTIKTKIPIENTESEYEGFKYYRVKYPESYFEWLSFLTSIKNIHDLKSITPSILVAYNYPAIALLRLKNYCSRNNIKIIADCTEWYEVKGNGMFKILKSIDVNLRMKLIHPKLDGLIVISKYLLEYYKKKNTNIILLPPLVDITNEKWKFSDSSNENNIINLVYAGSPGNGQKDRIDQIINILSIIKDKTQIQFIFNIVGLAKTEYLKLFGSETLRPNIDEFVSFKGRLSHNDTLKEIHKADYQIFLRDKNLTNTAGFPTKLVEAISCGTPVLTNSTSNIEDYLISGKTGFLLDNSTNESLEESLTKALSVSKVTLKKMSDFCLNSRMFDYNNYTALFEDFINKIHINPTEN